MRWIVSKIAGLGDYFISLSDRARMQLVVFALLILGGGGVYKLIVSINRLNEPLPAASPEQLMKPMERLFRDTKTTVNGYQRSRQEGMNELDSLAKAYSNKKITSP